MASMKQRKMQELNELLQKDKYKRTPGQKQEASNNRLSESLRSAMLTKEERKKRLGSDIFKKRSRGSTNKKAGGKVGSKNNAKKGGAPHNRLY